MTNTPICGYCGLPEHWHYPNDHVFDAVGGSLKAIDPRNGPPLTFAGKGRRIIIYGVLVWAVIFGIVLLATHKRHPSAASHPIFVSTAIERA